MRTRVESIDESVARLSAAHRRGGARAQQTRAEFETVQSRVGELDAGEVGLDDHHDRTVAALRLRRRTGRRTAGRRARRRAAGGVAAGAHRGPVGWPGPQGRRRVAARRTAAGQGFSGRSPIWSRCARVTSLRSPRCSGRRPTRWPPTSFGAARSAVAALKEADGGRAAIVLGDWPAERPGAAARCPRARCGRWIWSRRRRGCAAR